MKGTRDDREEPQGVDPVPPDPSDPGGSGPVAAPGDPGLVGCDSAQTPERRRFLGYLTAGMGALAGTALLVPWARLFLTPGARPDPEVWRGVGSVSDFPVGDTVRVAYLDPAPLPWAGFAARNAAWVRREADEEFTAFTAYCTHVGCPVRWDAGARLFFCPCHGGAFRADGAVAAGPPPRPLDRYPVRVRDGIVEIRTVGVPDPSG